MELAKTKPEGVQRVDRHFRESGNLIKKDLSFYERSFYYASIRPSFSNFSHDRGGGGAYAAVPGDCNCDGHLRIR